MTTPNGNAVIIQSVHKMVTLYDPVMTTPTGNAVITLSVKATDHSLSGPAVTPSVTIMATPSVNTIVIPGASQMCRF